MSGYQCPCCGAGVESVGLDQLPYIQTLTPKQSDIIDCIVSRHPRKVTGQDLFDWLYGDDPNGGPTGGIRTVQALVCQLRPKLEGCGWKLSKIEHGDRKTVDRQSHGYRLERA